MVGLQCQYYIVMTVSERQWIALSVYLKSPTEEFIFRKKI